MTASPPSDERQSQTATLSTAFERSRTAGGMRTVRRWSENAWLFAFVSVWIRQLARILTRWVGGSVLYMAVFGLVDRGSTTLARWIEHSRGYRWITADPDPGVIVIDLRETKTVGPLCGLLDRVLAIGVPAVSHARTWQLSRSVVCRGLDKPLRFVGGGLLLVAGLSALRLVIVGSGDWIAVGGVLAVALVGLRFIVDKRSWAELRTARPVRVLAAVFAPPEPPEDSSAGTETDREHQSERE